MTSPARPEHLERHVYAAPRKPEVFMVPLLKQAIEEGLAAQAGGGEGKKALDVGCGRQPFRSVLTGLGYRYFGLDTLNSPDLPLDFVGAIDGALPEALFVGGPYDFILCTEVLEHVALWETAFANLAKLLAPGGKLLLTSPMFYILHERPYDFFRPTLHAFEAHARHAGLTVVEARPLGDCWDILGTMLGCCRFEPASTKRMDRMWAYFLWRLRNWAFERIKNGAIRKRVTFTGPTYLSNYVVLQKPSAP